MLANELWDHAKRYVWVASQRTIETEAGYVSEFHAWLPIEGVV